MANTSIKQISEAMKLSPGTVSLVLNGRGDELRISKKTQERVLEEAKRLGYQPNIHARRLRQHTGKRATAIIGVLWPSLYSTEMLIRFFDGIQHSILEDKQDIEVVYKPYPYNVMEQIGEVFRNNLFNGVIIVGASEQDIAFIRSIQCTMPIVFFNRQIDHQSGVCVDDYQTGAKVAELFHARGHQYVGLVESNLLIRHHTIRKLGFFDTCQHLGMTVMPETLQDAGTEEGGRRVAAQLLLKDRLPTALFFTLGGMMQGVYTVLQQSGIRIPGDIEIVGYADTLINQYLRPPLTVVDFPVQQIVRKCISLLTEMANGTILHPVTMFEDTQFIFRGSCGGFPVQENK